MLDVTKWVLGVCATLFPMCVIFSVIRDLKASGEQIGMTDRAHPIVDPLHKLPTEVANTRQTKLQRQRKQ